MSAVIYDPLHVGIKLNLDELSDADLQTFICQSIDLRDRVAAGWLALSDVFNSLIFIGQLNTNRRTSSTPVDMGPGAITIGVLTDDTAPVDQQVDEYGRAMALIMPLVEDQTLSPEIRRTWNDAIRELAREVRVRQFQRLG
jgi:hypothetical protein